MAKTEKPRSPKSKLYSRKGAAPSRAMRRAMQEPPSSELAFARYSMKARDFIDNSNREAMQNIPHHTSGVLGISGPGATAFNEAIERAAAKRIAVALYIVRSLRFMNECAGEGITFGSSNIPEPDLTVFDLWRAFGEPDELDEDNQGHALAAAVLKMFDLDMPPADVETTDEPEVT